MQKKFPSLPSFVLHCDCSVTGLLELNRNGEDIIAIGRVDGRVEIFEAETYQHIETAYAHPTQSVISSLSAIRDYLVIHVRDYGVVALRFIDKEWKIMSSRTFIINHAGFCGSAVADDSLFMPTSEGSSNSISVMSLEGESLRKEFRFSESAATPTCVVTDGASVFVGSDSGSVMALNSKERMAETSLCKSPVFALAVNDKNLAAGSSADAPIYILNKENLHEPPTTIQYNTKATGVSSLCFSPSGSTLFGGFWDGTVRGFSMKTRRIVLFLDFHVQTINCLRWIDDRRLAMTSKDGRVSFWSL